MEDDALADLAAARRQLGKLRKSMGSGVLTVESPDTGRVTYRSYGEMRTAERDLVSRIAALEAETTGGPRRARTRRVVLTGRSGF